MAFSENRFRTARALLVLALLLGLAVPFLPLVMRFWIGDGLDPRTGWDPYDLADFIRDTVIHFRSPSHYPGPIGIKPFTAAAFFPLFYLLLLTAPFLARFYAGAPALVWVARFLTVCLLPAPVLFRHPAAGAWVLYLAILLLNLGIFLIPRHRAILPSGPVP